MSRRRGRVIARAAAVLAVVSIGALPACQTDSPSSNCQLAPNSVLPGSPLMLLPAARLDRVAQWFVLIGADGGGGASGGTVRWATIELDGQAGPERSAAVPPFTAGPWFAVAGDKTAGDSIVIAFGKAAANGTDLDLFVMTAASDGATPATAPSMVATILGAGAPGATINVAMASSITGSRAALAWVAPAAAPAAGAPAPRGAAAGAGAIKTLLLAGNGQAIGSTLSIDTVAGSTCLSFVSGRGDLTVGYLRYETPTSPTPEWSMAELRDNASIEFTLALPLESQSPNCPRVAPTTAGGYVLGWQDAGGSRIGVYNTATNRFYPRLFVTSVEFGGADVQPPLVGLGEVTRDFAVLFSRARSSEVWRVEAMGARRPGQLTLPSVRGDMGQVSAVPLGGAIFATYADYGATAAAPDAGAPLDTAAPEVAPEAPPDAMPDAPSTEAGIADGGAPDARAADASVPEAPVEVRADTLPAPDAARDTPTARTGQRIFVKISCF